MAQLQATGVTGSLVTTGNVGIGTTNPILKLHVLTTTDLPRGVMVQQTLASSYAEVHFSASREYRIGTGGSTSAAEAANNWYIYDATAAAQRLVINSGGNVGIGKTNPAQELHIKAFSGTNADIRLEGATSTNYTDFYRGDSAGGIYVYGNTDFGIGSNAGGGNNIFVVDVSAGCIGIGTSAPLARLHIGDNTSTYGPTIFLDGTFESSASVGHSRIYFNDNNFGIGAGKWGPGTDDDLYIWSYNGGGRDIRFAFTTDGSQPVTSSAWTTRMILKSEGSLGIGTTNPTEKLTIFGGVGSPATSGTGANGNLAIESSNGNSLYFGSYAASPYGGWMQVSNYVDQSIYYPIILNPLGGNVGIGTTSPSSRLHVYENADVWHARFGTADGELRIGGCTGNGAVIQAYTPAGTTRQLYIQRDGGNVGIGTTVPAGLLHLNGAGGNGIPSFRITSTASDIFNWPSSVEYPNLATGETVIHLFGKANSITNQAYVGYRHVSDGSTSNMLTMGLYGYDYLVNINAAGNMGIGVTTPSRWLTVSRAGAGNGTQQQVAFFGNTTVGATSAAIYIGAYTGTDWLIGKNIYGVSSLTNFQIGDQGTSTSYFDIITGGNVGIGTTAPVGLLNVYSTGTTYTNPAASNVPVIYVYNGSNASTNAHAILSLRTGGSSGGDPFVSFDVDSDAGWAFGLDNSDSNKMKLNFGWDTLTSNTKLTVTTNGTLLVSGSVVPSEGPWKGTAVFGPDGQDKVIIGTLISSYTGATIGGHPSALNAWDDLNIGGGNLIFRATEVEYMRMNTSGNFGVGTSSPTNKLHIRGGAADDVIARFETTGTGTNDYAEIHIANNADERLIFGSIGSNYTGTNWAGARYVYNTSGKLYLKSVDELQLFSGGTDLANITMTLTRGGNVGIGTTSPSIYSRLHVNTKKMLITSDSNSWGQLQVANPSDGESTIAVAAGGSGAVGNDSTYTRQWIHGINPYGTGTSRYTFTTKYRQGTTPSLMMEEAAGGNVGINPSGGNVGINTIGAAANLHVDSGTTGATAYPFRTDAASLDYALYVSASGNVAIGGLVPANQLNHKLVVFSGSVSLRGPNDPAFSYRLNDTAGTNRNALYVSSSNYLNVGNAAFAGLQLFHTGSFDTRYTPTVGFEESRIIGNINDDQMLGTPNNWLAIRINTINYVLPMYQV
jgi:hypothetical protein